MGQRRSSKSARQKRKAVKVRGIKPLHFLKRVAEEMEIGTEAWVSLDGKTTFPARVVGKDDRHYDVEFQCSARRSGVYRDWKYSFFRDEVRSTPQLACVNMVTM